MVILEGDALSLSRGPGLNGRLLHWYGDTFRPVWANDMPGSGFVTFALSGGSVLQFEEGDLGVFHRLPE
jgi:hypothetical protein